VVARWAHNPKVGGSNPPSATKKKPWRWAPRLFCFYADARLRGGGMKTKSRSCAQHSVAFSLLSTPKRIKPNEVRYNPPFFYPKPPKGLKNLQRRTNEQRIQKFCILHSIVQMIILQSLLNAEGGCRAFSLGYY
jgi:hypothetical protein